MKKVIVMLAVLAIAAPVMAFHSNDSGRYDCDACHVPHNASALVDMPLWSGTGITDAASYTNYESASMDATAGMPAGSTLLCLACHDATDPSNHYLVNSTGGDLTGTHPMEFIYDTDLAAADGELYDPSTTMSGILSPVDGGDPEALTTIADDLLSPTDDTLNCVSCHDIHIQGLHGYDLDWTKDIQATGTAGETGTGYVNDADGNSWVDDNNDGIADLSGYGNPIPVIAETLTGSKSFGVPHLQNIAGIAWKTGWGGDPELDDDYEMDYGALCKTCHIK
jgi:hypothetical protein